MIEKEKKIVIFEGLGCSGKSALIQRLKNDLSSYYKVEILDNKHPIHASMLFNRNNEIVFTKEKYAFFSFRWTRLFLFINHIIKSESNLFLLDRGLLTNYIYGIEDGIPESVILGFIDEILCVIEKENIKYQSVITDCKLDIANFRFNSRDGIDLNQKITRNFKFAPYLTNFSSYHFIKEHLILNTSDSIFEDYQKLLNFIKS